MKRSSLIFPLISLLAVPVTAFAQDQAALNATRPRVVQLHSAEKTQAPVTQQPVNVPDKKPETKIPSETRVVTPTQNSTAQVPATVLTPQLIRTRIAEAERLLKSRPKTTAMTSPSTDFVTLAATDGVGGSIHLISLSKENFLTKGTEVKLPSSLGTPLNVRIVRANGVNTAVTIFDDAGKSYIPLVVEFPIEKGGVFREMAYYTSAHPALLSSDLTAAGRGYVKTMLDLAAKRLRERGAFISPQIVDIAERLCLVEHVDHDRYRKENLPSLFSEVHSLYALNELDTYRYSVSVAGAGGMVQMIPWAYNLMRQRHPAVGLNPDFVVGMRNHANALQAMLLYMQDTWNDLSGNEDVQYALNSKVATQPELLAAGYNSNAAKLPSYLRRGGAGWRALIPRETQLYLQIYKSIDSLVPMTPRATAVTSTASADK